MKNKVDISKIIKQKYEEDTFELNDLLEEIDLVLDESDQSSYHSKVVRNGVSDSIPEKLSQGLDIQRHVNNSLGTNGAPRQERPGEAGYGGREPNNIVPDKIAEAPQKGPMSLARQRTIKVPDLFSMVTDPKRMSVGSSDRELINNIIANIGLQQTTSWREKIEKLQDHVYKLLVPSEQQTDITQVISGLIFLNLFKKLSFFMDHPGKQFEYLFLPFLSPEAEVRGDEKTEITDVVFDGKEYSLKFLIARDPSVKGSLRNIMNKIKDNKYSMTLVARVMPAGIIEFAEFGVTTFHDFVLQNYKIIGNQRENATSLWFESKSGGGDYPRFMCLLEPQREKLAGIETGTDKTKIKQFSYNLGGSSFAEKDLRTLLNKLNDAEVNVRSKKQEDNLKAIKILSDTFKEFQNKPDSEKNSRKIMLDFIESIRKQIADQSEKIRIAKGIQESLQEQETGIGQFDIPIQGIWNTIVIQKLNLGNPEIYNKQLGFVAGEISNFYVDMLDSLDQLNTNMTNYVATSSDSQRSTGSQTYAFKSIKNAQDIKEKILKIQSSKKK